MYSKFQLWHINKSTDELPRTLVQSDKDGYRSYLKSEATPCMELGQYYHFFISIPHQDLPCNTSYIAYKNFLSMKCSGPSKNCSSNFEEMDQEFEGILYA